MSIFGTRLRAGLTAALLASSVLSSGALIAQPAAAQAAQEYLFDLPAMPARRSLAEIGRITGLSVVYDETPAASVTAAPVSGNLAPAQALARALAPTGLNYAISGDTVVIRNGASQVAADAVPGAGEAILLEPITIEAESNETLQQRGYIALSGRQAMRIETDIKELPQSVGVVTQDQMEDQGPRTLLDALDYTAGVTTGNYGFDSRYDSYHLRGFGAYQVGNFLDGLRSYNGLSSWYKAEPYLLEGIAILKGPVSSNFGVSTPGGVVNMVTKRPKDNAYNEIRLSYGSHGRKEIAGDFTGPVDAEGDTLYRLVVLARDANTHIDGYADDKLAIAPSLSFRLADDQRLLLTAEYSRVHTGAVAYMHFDDWTMVDPVLTDAPAGDPSYNDYDMDQYRLGYEYSWDISDSTRLRHAYRFTRVKSDMAYGTRSGIYPDLTTTSWQRYEETADAHVADVMLEHHFSAGGFDHSIAAGADYSTGEYKAYFGWTSDGRAANDAMTPPLYSWNDQTQKGLYLTEQAQSDRLTLSAALRKDWLTTRSGADSLEDGYEQDDSALTWRLGASYAATQSLNLFANASTSFAPNVQRIYADTSDYVGEAAIPTEARQSEIGFKYLSPDENLSLTGTLFHIRQDKGMIVETMTDGRNTGRQYDLTSRGVELEAAMNLTGGFSMIGAYTYNKVTVNQGADGAEGRDLWGVPRHSASIFAKYEWSQGALEGLGVMAGLRVYGRSVAQAETTPDNGGRAYVDLGISYDLARHGQPGTVAQLNVRNLFDRRERTCTNWCYADEPRFINVSLSRRF
ncbi:TonB-dependent siderophore receptor [Paracoccus yeei]|uniref:TonB-dependent siderophore receptor n=1 Tax=Paracoccus yeei TaxID=147645 RepID=UPI00174C308D|nr:TonB-dependent siderophore receptor [Paracoccus yeei]